MEDRVLTSIEKTVIEGEVIEALRQVFDPEIPVNVYDLGLIYGITVNDDRTVHIMMTLTTPMCPVAEILPVEAEQSVRDNTSAKDVKVELTWDPPFSLDMVSEEVKLQLGLIW